MARPAGIDKTASSLPVATDDSVALETSDEEVETGLGGGAAGCWGSKVAKDSGVDGSTVESGCWRREILAAMSVFPAGEDSAGGRALMVTWEFRGRMAWTKGSGVNIGATVAAEAVAVEVPED